LSEDCFVEEDDALDASDGEEGVPDLEGATTATTLELEEALRGDLEEEPLEERDELSVMAGLVVLLLDTSCGKGAMLKLLPGSCD